MEFIAGVDLNAWRRQGPHAWPEVLAVYRQAGLGLAAAHARGVVHRDFTPRNAMLGEDGRVRVLNFGLAHARRDTGEGGAPGEGGEGGEGGAVVARSEPSSGARQRQGRSSGRRATCRPSIAERADRRAQQ